MASIDVIVESGAKLFVVKVVKIEDIIQVTWLQLVYAQCRVATIGQNCSSLNWLLPT